MSGGVFPLICVPLVGRSRDAVLAEVDVVLPKKPDVLEWRVDFFEALGDTTHVIDTARAIRDRVGPIPVMFTRRSSIEGGEKIALTEPQVVQLYVEVCASRLVDLIDYETVNAAAGFRRLRAVSREHDIALIGRITTSRERRTPLRSPPSSRLRKGSRRTSRRWRSCPTDRRTSSPCSGRRMTRANR